MTGWTQIMTSKSLFQTNFTLKSHRVTTFFDIIKIVSMSRNLEIMSQNSSVSLLTDMTKFADFWRKHTDIRRTQVVCNMIHIFFRSC